MVDLATASISNIVNSDVDAAAGIVASKLNLATISDNIAHSGTMSHSGTVTMSSKAINQAQGSNIASATTTDIGAATGNYVVVTGTTTITGLGTVQAGTQRIVEFSGALTLTHNATSLILPGGANITTAAGDVAIFISEGSGNWRCASYTKASGVATIVATPSFSQAQTGSPSAASTIPISGLVAGSKYKLVFTTIQNTSAADWQLTFNGDTGSNYKYQNVAAASGSASGGGSTSAANIILTRAVGETAAASNAVFGELFIQPKSGDSTIVYVTGILGFQGASSGYTASVCQGQYDGASSVTSLTITPSAGTITGVWYLYLIV